MNGKRYTERRTRRNGFYLALAVCLVAVGVAAWSTYDAVTSYNNANQSAASRMTASSSAANAARSDDPEASRARSSTAPAPSVSASPEAGTASGWTERSTQNEVPNAGSAPAGTPGPVASSPVRQTAGTVTESPEETAEEPEEEDPPKVPANAPMYEWSEEMIFPLDGEEVQQAYSAGAPVYSETMKDWRIHAGADLAAEAGEEVKACANGLVKRTYVDRMLGNVILIEHGDYEFSYCGVSENFLVSEGDIVTKGQTIGTVTAVPMEAAQEPHLHVEVRRDGVYLDPVAVLEGE